LPKPKAPKPGSIVRGPAIDRGIHELCKVGPRGALIPLGRFDIAYHDAAGVRRWARGKGPETLAEARARQRDLYSRARAKTTADVTTLRAWHAEYMKAREENPNLEPATLKRDWDAWVHIKKLGNLPLSGLTTPVVQTWLNSLTMTLGKCDETRRVVPASDTHKRLMYTKLVAVLRGAARVGHFGAEHAGRAAKSWRPPCDDVVLPRKPEGGRDEILGDTERARLLDAAFKHGGTRSVVACILGLVGAFRHGELAPLRWGEHVTFHVGPGAGPLDESSLDLAGEARVWLNAEHTKTKTPRVEIIFPPELEHFVALRREGREGGPVFARARDYRRYGRTIRSADDSLSDAMPFDRWRRIRADAGLPPDFPFHALRHSAARDMIEAGAPVSAVQLKLGHKHTSTTLVYTQRHPAAREAAIRAIVQGGEGRAALLGERIRAGLGRADLPAPAPRPTNHPCVACGQPSLAFCVACGTRQPPRTCGRCGAFYAAPEARFCAECGEARPLKPPAAKPTEPGTTPPPRHAEPHDAEPAASEITQATTRRRGRPATTPATPYAVRVREGMERRGLTSIELARALERELPNRSAASWAPDLSKFWRGGWCPDDGLRLPFGRALSRILRDGWLADDANIPRRGSE
jgi:integrase